MLRRCLSTATTAAWPRPLRVATLQRPILVLGIETSCDDTSVALVDSNCTIRALVTRNQNALHEPTGGIVPTNAAIAHSMALPAVIREALDAAGLHSLKDLEQIDAIAATRGPGLAPCLGVGLCAAKNLAGMLNVPLIGVHHMEAHALTPRLTESPAPVFPYLSLLVSGGHSLLILTEGLGQHTILGTSLDDAVGEAFDKTARTLGLRWLDTGGGAALAATGSHKVTFPIPLRDGRDKPHTRLNFSFSGLKTAVTRHVAALPPDALTPAVQADIAAAFQRSAVAHLEDRVRRALVHLREERKVAVTSVVVAGGVAANRTVRNRIEMAAREVAGVPVFVPPPRLCTDNAAMIAWTGVERYLANRAVTMWDVDYVPKWPLGEYTE
ncbi:glycoprotease family-domain-containing protein [Blastocladiella britannica]|nr:glycoprotease family-domain-containing protein [Blastocladiella britannica]